MKNILIKAIIPIKNATGLNIDLYSAGGDLLYGKSAGGLAYDAACLADAPIACEKSGSTYFLAAAKGHEFVGAVEGTGEAARNYALMLAQILGVAIQTANAPYDEQIKLLVRGRLSKDDLEQLAADPNPPCFYVLALTACDVKKADRLANLLKAIAEKGDIIAPHTPDTIIYLKKVGAQRDYRSAGEFAHTLYDNLSEETNVKFGIGIGGVAYKAEDIPSVVDYSITAYKFGRLIDPESHVYSYKEYALHKLLDSLPRETLAKYLSVLLDADEILRDSEMMRTADVFLKNSLNMSEAARLLYLHRNTLSYRLDRIEDATGLNIRYFSDAVIFRIIVTLSKLVGS